MFKDDRFSGLDYLKYFSLDLFAENMTSKQQKLDIIKQHNPEHYSEYQKLTAISDAEIEIEFFPLSFSLKIEGIKFRGFFADPFQYYSEEWDKLKANDRSKFLGLYLLVVCNGTIVKKEFLAENTTEEKQIHDAISEICGNGITRRQIIEQLKTLENLFIIRDNDMFIPPDSSMFDFLVYYFGTNMQESFIKHAHTKVISERTQLKSTNNDEHTTKYIKVIISAGNETIYFQRIVSDIYAGKVWDALGNSQMIRDSKFRLKALKHFKELKNEDIKKLVQSRDISLKNENASPLYIAAFFNLKIVVTFLLEHTDPYALNEEQHPPLIAACKRGNVEITTLLLQHGMSVNKANKDGIRPLIVACKYGHQNIVELLIKHSANLEENKANKDGIIPLIVACKYGHQNIVELLIKHSANLEETDRNGMTPLHWACAMQHEDIAKYLCDKNANVEATSNLGLTPLIWCCIMGKLSLVRLLVKRNASIDTGNICGKNPLMAACFFRRKNIITFLLDNHANIDHVDEDGWTPLMEACFDNDNDGWNIFLEQFEEKLSWIPLLSLVANLEKDCDDHIGDNEIVEMLLNKGADIDKIDKDGKTALLHACEGRYNRIVNILMKRGADVNIKDNNGETPLIEACYGEDEDVFLPLLEAGSSQIKPMIDQLIAAGADTNAENEAGWNPFFDACEKGKIDIAAKLIKHMRDVNESNTEGYSPLELALQNGHSSIYALFKDEGLVEDEMVRKLTEATCKEINNYVNVEDELTEETMCKKKESSLKEVNVEDELIEACKNGNLDKVENLIDDSVDVNCQNYSDRTPLLEACKGNFVEIFDLLIDAGAHVYKTDERCRTPLYEACKAGANDIVERLLKLPLPCDVNASDDRGFSPMLIACQNGHLSIIELLIDRGADVNIANNAGITPLIVASSKGDILMVQMLLRKRADVNKSDAYGDTPLMAASYFGHLEIVKLLCSKSAHVDVKDCQGYTCLSWACKGKDRNLVEFILESNKSLLTLDKNPVVENF